MTGDERRTQLVSWLRVSTSPLSGDELASRAGVSRQAIAGDIARLRASGLDIRATPRGYLLPGASSHRRVVKVRHTRAQIPAELRAVVDCGGSVLDVMVNHRIYGKIRVALGIRNRRDINRFLEELASGKSAPLMHVTSDYHFHTIEAGSEETLDVVEARLAALGFRAEWGPGESADQFDELQPL